MKSIRSYELGIYPSKIICILIMWIAPLYATENNEFAHGTWHLQCDNTGACCAVGYQLDDGSSEPVLLQVSREAGPNSQIDITLMPYSDTDFAKPIRLQVGRVVIDGLHGNTPVIPATEVQRLLPQLLERETALVSTDGKEWHLSLMGAKAVLLKMDELQGRVNTPGAIVARGQRAESSVPQPIPAPIIKAVTPLPLQPDDKTIVKNMLAKLPTAERKIFAENCNDQEIDLSGINVFRLDKKTLLLSLSCNIGAYNHTSFLWTMRDTEPYQLQALEMSGEFDDKDGSITSSMKLRGRGDCWAFESWQYDGQSFVRSSASADAWCAGIPYGWQLTSYVTKVLPAER